MPKEYVLAVIGSGSTYTPELVDGIIARRDSLRFKEIRLMDIDARKRTIVGELCRRMIAASGLACDVSLTDNLDDALRGADFVVSQIRVGRLPARILDETEALRALMIHPLIGDFHAASACFEALKQAHREYLPLFWQKDAEAGANK